MIDDDTGVCANSISLPGARASYPDVKAVIIGRPSQP
jgi:hypothetical protein